MQGEALSSSSSLFPTWCYYHGAAEQTCQPAQYNLICNLWPCRNLSLPPLLATSSISLPLSPSFPPSERCLWWIQFRQSLTLLPIKHTNTQPCVCQHIKRQQNRAPMNADGTSTNMARNGSECFVLRTSTNILIFILISTSFDATRDGPPNLINHSSLISLLPKQETGKHSCLVFRGF